MWSSSITCAIARLLWVQVYVCAGVCVEGGRMWKCIRLFIYVDEQKEWQSGRERQTEREKERFGRELYLQTAGWLPTGAMRDQTERLRVRRERECVCVCSHIWEEKRRERDRQREGERGGRKGEEPVQPISAATFQPVLHEVSPWIWTLFAPVSSAIPSPRFPDAELWPHFRYVCQLFCL